MLKMVTLITPKTRGFRRGMSCDEAVAAFARTASPLLYFLVSPGDQPLLLSGVREYRGWVPRLSCNYVSKKEFPPFHPL